MHRLHESLRSGSPKALIAAALLITQCCCLSVTAAAAPETGVSDQEVTLGLCGAFSGPAALLGSQQLIGVSAYLASMNAAGGIHGRKIRVNHYDDGYSAAKAPLAFQKMVEDNCFAGIAFVGSGPSEMYLPLIEKDKVPVVGFMTGADFLQTPLHPHAFSVRATYNREMRAQIDRLVNDLGLQRFTIIHQELPGGSPIQRAAEAALAAHGLKPVAVASFPTNTLNVDPALKIARASHPDVVVMTGPYSPLAEIVKRSHAMGWSPLFMTSSMVGTEDFVQTAGKDADGTLISQVLPPYSRDDLKTVALYKATLRQYFPNEKPNFISFEGFVDAMVLCRALEKAGKDLTRDRLIAALESLRGEDLGLGSNLKLGYDHNRHQGLDGVYTTQIRDGQPMAYFSAKTLRR